MGRMERSPDESRQQEPRQQEPRQQESRQRGAVAVCVRHGRMLVIRRSQKVVAPLTYCFPGGGIEPGESDRQALIREFREEIGVDVSPLRRIWQSVTAWQVELSWWLAELPADAVPTPNLEEVESILWVTPAEMLQLPGLLSSNREFLELVQRGEIRLAVDGLRPV